MLVFWMNPSASVTFNAKMIADKHGGNAVFVLLAAPAGVGTLPSALCCPAQAHKYQ
ncbi:hypothetical protein [Lacipirellula limnantheis]|uniref:Uncharacterized protein n=1 Tax=Lacipirellula limnantheis TaxID=2528024 RepID=A0A517TRM1_9BACT|nr:hypothetical protein [Lacipirellula limnantheis]QDT71021.1 hypothetical protein I41_01760 [Lacipirellula limnantheis]